MKSSEETKEIWSKDARNYNNYIQKEINDFHLKVWQEAIIKEIPNQQELKILDIGTGPGFFPVILGKLGYWVMGIDLAEDMLKIAKINIKKAKLEQLCKIEKRDALSTGFEAESFDVIVCRNVSWTLEEPEQAYREWYRILKKGGTLLIFDSAWFHYLFNKKEQKRIDEYLDNYHAVTGQLHDTYEKNKDKDVYRKSRPLSAKERPQWDCDTLKKIGFSSIRTDTKIGEMLYDEEEQFKYGITPMFKIYAKKEV